MYSQTEKNLNEANSPKKIVRNQNSCRSDALILFYKQKHLLSGRTSLIAISW
jgi:hypothetical protein